MSQSLFLPIGGVEPASMLERPGMISTIVFVKGCNFKCPFCHNPELVFQDKDIPDYPLEGFFKILDEKRGWVDSVIFTGGEPTLYPDLPKVMQKVKSQGFSLGLHTNGTNPEMLEALLKAKLLDYLAMDIKNILPKYPKTAGTPQLNLKDIEKSIALIKKAPAKVDTIFRTTVVPDLVSEKDIKKLGQLLKGAKKASLQQFRTLKCLDRSFEKKHPYPKETLEAMANELGKYVKEVERDFL